MHYCFRVENDSAIVETRSGQSGYLDIWLFQELFKEPEYAQVKGKPRMHLNPSLFLQKLLSLDEMLYSEGKLFSS